MKDQLQKAREALERAQTGLKWYRDAHSEDDSGADDEMDAEIEEALTALAQLEAMVGEPVALAQIEHTVGGSIEHMPLKAAWKLPMGVRFDLYASPVAQQPQPLSRDRIREIFMAHGFTIKEGQTDLKEYVYEAAEALLNAAQAQPPQAEPITEAAIDAYLDDYEMRGETENGRDVCYTPSEGEKFLIKDAIMGLLAEIPPKQPQVEAVAWRARDANGRWMYGDLPAPDLPAGEAELLALAAPQQAEAVTAKAIVARIKEAVREKPTAANSYGLSVWANAEKWIADAINTPQQPQAEAVPQTAEFCWLVEHFEGDGTGNSTGHYHTGFTDLLGSSRMTKDPLQAKRYDTWREANIVSVRLGSTLTGTWRAVQHGFHTMPQQAEPDMRKVCEALGFDPTNHHNAAKCPYCRGQQPQAEAVPQNWRIVLPGGKHTDKWESARVADYNQGWNDYRKTAKDNLEKLEAAPQQAEAVPPGYVLVHSAVLRKLGIEDAVIEAIAQQKGGV